MAFVVCAVKLRNSVWGTVGLGRENLGSCISSLQVHPFLRDAKDRVGMKNGSGLFGTMAFTPSL